MTSQQNSNKDLKPVYYIYGDQFQVEEAVRRLKKRVGERGDALLNVREFEAGAGAEVAAEAVQAAGTLPFFGETHLVVVRRADRLPKDEQKILADYVAAPSPATVLVLTAEKALKTGQLYKLVDKAKGAYEYKAPKGAELVRWVTGLIQEQGKKVDGAVARHLVDVVGTDQSALTQEAIKLAMYAGDQETVTVGDVDEVATRNPEANIFEMVDALGHKQADTALTVLNRLLFNGEAPQRVLAMIVRQFRILLKTKALEGKRLSAGEATPILGVKPYLVDKYRNQARSFSLPELKKIYGFLKDTDVAIKTGAREPGLALEMLIGKITTGVSGVT